MDGGYSPTDPGEASYSYESNPILAEQDHVE